MEQVEWLRTIVSDAASLKREATRRSKSYQELSVYKGAVGEFLEQGWDTVRELQRKTLLRRAWPHDERLENRVWCLFHLLGYPEISSGRQFKVRIERSGADPLYKQIDVLAKDDETVVVAECKSCDQVTRRSLQKDIEEFASLQRPISNAVRKHYGHQFKPKIIWLFVTSNIIWSAPDRQRAAGSGIRIITERELRYYSQIAEHLRSAARFQFLAEFLKDQKIPEMENVRVPACRGKLGEHTFYSFVSTPKQMLKIAFVNHRSLNDPEGAPAYQRLVSRTRLRQISKFLHSGGFFPTNILVNFTERCRFELIATDPDTNVAFGHLYLPCRYRSAWIIDGQHRLYGYAPLSNEEMGQNIMVVAFEKMAKQEEANLFVTINHEQKSVPKNLLDDLEGELKWGSTRPAERVGAVSARLINLLNTDFGEALYGRVTQQGISPTEKTCLTVPELKNGLRRSGLVGKSILGGREYSPGPLTDLTDTLTLERARDVLNAYFGQFSAANTELWEVGRQGFLCTNIALQAHFQLLSALIAFMEIKKSMTARELEPLELMAEIGEYLIPILTWAAAMSPELMAQQFRGQYGSGGPIPYYYHLCGLVHQDFPDFRPEGLENWIAEQSQERITEADRQIKELNILIQKFIFDRLKDIHGTQNDAYWDRGVRDRDIKTEAYRKSLEYDAEDRLPLEHYLDFIDYRKIVEDRDHWSVFKPVFDIPEPGVRGQAKNLGWMQRINELRRVSAHATESRGYKLEDLDYIGRVHGEFKRRVEQYHQAASFDTEPEA
jgi:DNA sulfur modification protein DndB